MNQRRDKLKVVWICHFTNAEMQEQLPLWKKKNEASPWIYNYAKGFENRDDYELHIITPHEFLKRITSFNIRGVNYHFVPAGIPIIRRYWPSQFKLDAIHNFYFFRQKVKKIINRITPDIINLMGTENAHYSASIFDYYKKYPVLITIQGFITEHRGMVRMDMRTRNRIAVEEKILRNIHFYSGEMDSEKYLKKYSNKNELFLQYFPVNEQLLSSIKEQTIKYDCVYYGRLAKSKGAEDFIKVISLLKKNNNDIRAGLIGLGNKLPFIKLAKELDCIDNIEFVGYVRTQRELFAHVKSARIVLIPTLKDRLPSTIREVMYLKVPVIAYATGSIPHININIENICIVSKGNYKEMAVKVEELLKNNKLQEQLIQRAYAYAKNEYGVEVNTERITRIYNKIINGL